MKREHLSETSGGDLPDISFAEDCIFYAPLTQGDLTDHISGVTGVIASGSTINWDSAKGILNGTQTYIEYKPVLRLSDNKPGLYDITDQRFYTNAGTGEFLYA